MSDTREYVKKALKRKNGDASKEVLRVSCWKIGVADNGTTFVTFFDKAGTKYTYAVVGDCSFREGMYYAIRAISKKPKLSVNGKPYVVLWGVSIASRLFKDEYYKDDSPVQEVVPGEVNDEEEKEWEDMFAQPDAKSGLDLVAMIAESEEETLPVDPLLLA